MTEWKTRVAWTMRSACSQPLPAPIAVDVLIVHPCPTSDMRARAPIPRRWRARRADGDNVLKAVLDAGNGVLWVDDAHVVDGRYRSIIAAQGEAAGVYIAAVILEAEPPEPNQA